MPPLPVVVDELLLLDESADVSPPVVSESLWLEPPLTEPDAP